MKTRSQDISELLAYSLDNELTVEEQQILDNAMEKSPALRESKAKLLAMRALLSEQTIPKRPHFAEHVLSKLGDAKVISMEHRLLQLFPSVAAACVLVLIATYATVQFGGVEWIPESIAGTTSLTLEDAYVLLD